MVGDSYYPIMQQIPNLFGYLFGYLFGTCPVLVGYLWGKLVMTLPAYNIPEGRWKSDVLEITTAFEEWSYF